MSPAAESLRRAVEYGISEGKKNVIVADLQVLRELFDIADAVVRDAAVPTGGPIDPHRPLTTVLYEARQTHPTVAVVFTLWESGALKSFEECLITLCVNLLEANRNVTRAYTEMMRQMPMTPIVKTDAP